MERDGVSDHPLYGLWARVKKRCENPDDRSYVWYGGRGIRLYEGWRHDPRAFIGWVVENLGPQPDGTSLDRIDNDGNYEPGNLRWADASAQSKNRRTWGDSGIKGVYRRGPRRDGSFFWYAAVRVNGKLITSKRYDTMEEAVEWYESQKDMRQ